jgi:SAM-dependent methyltransferase
MDILRCPSCGGRLTATEVVVTCQSCGTTYPLEKHVPRFATVATLAERRAGVVTRGLHGLAAQPRVYDAISLLFGAREVRRRLGARLAPAEGATVLDLGAGTGSLAESLPPNATYVWLDPDPLKLRGYLTKATNPMAVVADATRVPFADNSVDWSVSVALSHHLDVVAFEQFLSETARVTKERFVFLDAVASPRFASRALWRYDRGAWPRTAAQLEEALSQRFKIEQVERFRIVHEYVLITGAPR